MKNTNTFLRRVIVATLFAMSALAGGGGSQVRQVVTCTGALEDGSNVSATILRNVDSYRLTGIVNVDGRPNPSEGWALELDYIQNDPPFGKDTVQYVFKSDLPYAANAGRYYSIFLNAHKDTREVSGTHFFFLYENGSSSHSKHTQLECVGNLKAP